MKMNKAIGGYNQIRLNNIKNDLLPDVGLFQSARAALYTYLKTAEIESIYLPTYICDSIIPCIQQLGIKIIWYSLDSKLLPTTIPKLANNECLLIVNYFGMNYNLISKLNFQQNDKIIIDNSQSLFSPHIPGTTSIYSPRKFLGIPDGGWLVTELEVDRPNKVWNSEENISHLLMRDAGLVEEGYKKFIEAEAALNDFTPHQMSKLTKHLIRCSDVNEIKIKRRVNYEYLYNALQDINEINFPLDDNVPLCFPLHFKEDINPVHKKLVSNNIFTPRYWIGKFNDSFSNTLYQNTLFLPIDERVSFKQLDIICGLLKGNER